MERLFAENEKVTSPEQLAPSAQFPRLYKENFMDIMNFLSPVTSYAKFAEVFNCEDKKGKFLFSWFDDVNKLKETSLPPIKAWHKDLKDIPLSEEEYLSCQEIWTKHNMTSMFDYLKWYNI